MNDAARFLLVSSYRLHCNVFDRRLDSRLVYVIKINVLATRRVGFVAEGHQYKAKWFHFVSLLVLLCQSILALLLFHNMIN